MKEEKLVIDLELAVKKEEFKMQKRIHRKLDLQKKENQRNKIISVFSWLC